MPFLNRLFSAIARLWRAQETLSVKNVRLGHLHYLLAFPLSMVFALRRPVLLDSQLAVNGISANVITFAAYIAGVLLAGAAATEQTIARISKIAFVLIAAGFVPWLFLPAGIPKLACAVVFMAGVGGCMLGATVSFAFALNNAERFFASALIMLFSGVAELFAESPFLPRPVARGLLCLIVAGIAACALFYRQQDFKGVKKRESQKFGPGVWLMLFLFLSYFLMKFVGMYLPGFSDPKALPIRAVFYLAALALCVVLQLVFRQSVWTMCNVFFISSICAYALGAAQFPRAANAFVGMKEIGLFVASYLIGCVTNKFCDFSGHKRLFLLIMAAMVPLYIIPDLLANTPLMYPVSIAVAAALFIVFLLLSPAFSRYLFSSSWNDDFRRLDMTEPAKPVARADKLEGLGLSPRERQVAAFLLQGMTMRQIAAELRIAQSTVNSYCTTLYRKLGINSRVELFVRFGVESAGQENWAQITRK